MSDSTRPTGWPVVLGSTVGLIVGNGPILLFTFGIFLLPVAQETGWQRGTMSLGVAIALTIAGLATPLVGRFIDKWGLRRVTLASITLFAASVAAIALTSASVTMFVLAYAVAGLFSSGQAPLPYAKAVSLWYDRRRGLALGIAMAGVGIGTAVMPQVASVLLKVLSWREAYVALAAITWIVAFPAVALFVKEPSVSQGSNNPGHATMAKGDKVSEALCSRNFWLMAVAVLLAVMAVNGAIAHLVALLTDRGMATSVAGKMLIGVGLSTIVGRLITGYLLDHIFAPYLAAGVFLVPVVGMLALLSGTASPVFGLAAGICFGFSLGAEVDIVGFLVGRYFGLRRYGEIYGYIFAIFTVGSGVGPYLMGLSFDGTHSYAPALVAFACMLLTASILISRLGPYRYVSNLFVGSPVGIAEQPPRAVRTPC
jgi:predicted MFS family arabinose efflux permease